MISYKPLVDTLRAKGISIQELQDKLHYYTLKDKLNRHTYLSLSTIDRICDLLEVGLKDVIEYKPREQHIIYESKRPVFVKPDWNRIKKLNGIRGFRILSVEMGFKPEYLSMLKRREYIGIELLQRIKEQLDYDNRSNYDLSSLYLDKREGKAPRKDKGKKKAASQSLTESSGETK